MLITAKCISFLVFGAEADFPVGNTLDIQKVAYRDIIGGKILAS
jgi:hypothetical protein